jgi:hypothetical protein
MVTTEDLKEFIESEYYKKTTEAIIKNTNIDIINEQNDIISSLEAAAVNRSELTIKELKNTLYEHNKIIIDFSIHKFLATHNIEELQEGQQEPDKTHRLEGYSKGFLVANIIEYSLALKSYQDLEDYLRKSRIPRAKYYAKKVSRIIDNLKNNYTGSA